MGQQMAFISEIHYRNTVTNCTGAADYVEISVSPEDTGRLSDLEVATYHPDGSLRRVFSLADLTGTTDPNTGWTIFRVLPPVTDPNHLGTGSKAEAVALLDAGTVQSFYDIGGATSRITALDGPAAGATSTNVPPTSGATIQFNLSGDRIDGPTSQNTSAICLTAGTMIDTKAGERLIEELEVGQLVRTLDNGFQPIRMIHKRRIGGDLLRCNRKLWPVCIQAGAMGFGLPARDLWVSPQNRMLYRHIRIPLLFGEKAVFIRAKSLAASFEEVFVDSGMSEVTYYHLVFDQHEVIFAESAATESFHAGPEGIAALDPETRTEFFDIFPEFSWGEAQPASYPTLRSWELLAMVG